MLRTHNKMLEPRNTHRASFSFTFLDVLPSKPKPDPRGYNNYVTIKEEVEDLTDLEYMPMEEGRDTIMDGSKERSKGGKTATFVENDSIEIPRVFPPNCLS